MNSSQPLGLVNIGPLVVVTKKLPLGTETLANLRIVHLRVLLSHLAPPIARPHHESVHGPLNSLQIDNQAARVAETTASAANDATHSDTENTRLVAAQTLLQAVHQDLVVVMRCVVKRRWWWRWRWQMMRVMMQMMMPKLLNNHYN
jgi:hypothetical protein